MADGRNLLVASSAVHDTVGWVLWIEAQAGRGWNADEGAALTLAALVVGRMVETAGGDVPAARWVRQARLRQQLEQTARVTRRLVHDLNNILTSVLGFTELGLAQTTEGSVLEDYLTEAYDVAKRGTDLTARLRLFSRTDPARAEPTPVASALAEEIARRRSEWGQAVTLRAELPDDLPPAICDPESLRNVVGCLLDNAREAIPVEGVVTLTARLAELAETDCLELLGTVAPGPHVALTVADNGRGFSAEARQRVFAEPLFSTRPRHGGVGLSVAYGLLRAQRGGLRLEHRDGEGTAVQIYLPACLMAAPPTTAAGGARGERILVVDDDPLILQLMCTTLERAGYQVEAALDGAQAFQAYTAAAQPFHLVLSDVVMPRMTGLDLTRQLLRVDARVNVLFISGQGHPNLTPDQWEGRRFELLPKPFRPDRLLTAVQAAPIRGAPACG
jgi:signal transduction histidine kinase